MSDQAPELHYEVDGRPGKFPLSKAPDSIYSALLDGRARLVEPPPPSEQEPSTT